MSELKEWYASGRDRTILRQPVVMPPDWLAMALRFCRNGADTMARYFKPVPKTYLDEQLNLVHCVCETVVLVGEREFVECPGECGRWFLREGGTVWAAKLPRDDS